MPKKRVLPIRQRLKKAQKSAVPKKMRDLKKQIDNLYSEENTFRTLFDQHNQSIQGLALKPPELDMRVWEGRQRWHRESAAQLKSTLESLYNRRKRLADALSRLEETMKK